MKLDVFEKAARDAKRAEQDAGYAKQLLDIRDLLQQLMHHHNAQAKESRPPVSLAYNKELAERCRVALDGGAR